MVRGAAHVPCAASPPRYIFVLEIGRGSFALDFLEIKRNYWIFFITDSGVKFTWRRRGRLDVKMLTHEDRSIRATLKGTDMHEDIQIRPLISELFLTFLARLTLSHSFDHDQKFYQGEIPFAVRLAVRNGLLLTFVTKSAARGYDTIPRPCFHDNFRFCSRCENTTRFDSS
jgi:hypothetical protein